MHLIYLGSFSSKIHSYSFNPRLFTLAFLSELQNFYFWKFHHLTLMADRLSDDPQLSSSTLVFMSCVIPSPRVWKGTVTCFNQHNVAKVMGCDLHDYVTKNSNFCLAADLPLPCCFGEASCYVVSWPMERSIRPLANIQWWTEAFSPTTHKELNPANNHVNLEADLSPVKPPDENPPLTDTLIAASRGFS